MDAWIVFGARTAYAVEVVETIWRTGAEVMALVDNLPDPPAQPWAHAVPVLGPDALGNDHRACRVAVPQTTPGHRQSVRDDARRLGFARFAALVDPTAVVARTAQVDDGVVVGARAVVGGCAQVGAFALVNRGASIGHHSAIGPYASLGPGCVLAGGVRVGAGTFVGAGAVLAPGVGVGSNSTVGAGAVVIADVPANCVVVGNPARVIRSGSPGFGGVGVRVDVTST